MLRHLEPVAFSHPPVRSISHSLQVDVSCSGFAFPSRLRKTLKRLVDSSGEKEKLCCLHAKKGRSVCKLMLGCYSKRKRLQSNVLQTGAQEKDLK